MPQILILRWVQVNFQNGQRIYIRPASQRQRSTRRRTNGWHDACTPNTISKPIIGLCINRHNTRAPPSRCYTTNTTSTSNSTVRACRRPPYLRRYASISLFHLMCTISLQCNYYIHSLAPTKPVVRSAGQVPNLTVSENLRLHPIIVLSRTDSISQCCVFTREHGVNWSKIIINLVWSITHMHHASLVHWRWLTGVRPVNSGHGRVGQPNTCRR
jgi:hypothetical protein